MRLSTSMIYQQQTRGIANSQKSWLESASQLSTNKRVAKPSDDPVASAQAVVLSQVQGQTAQYKTARMFATHSVSIETTTLDQVIRGIQSAQGSVVAIGNGALSDDDRATHATQLEGIRDQLLNLANSTDGNGRYIFAGYKSDVVPFTKDINGDVEYRGGDQTIHQKVDASRSITTSHIGSQVFDTLTSNVVKEPDGSASESNLFTTLNEVITSLRIPLADADDATKTAASAAIDKANRGLSNSLNNVLSVQSENGITLQELDALDSKEKGTSLILKTQMSALVDADYTNSVSNYYMQQAALQSSYTVFTQMSKMSLFMMNA